MCYSCNRLEKGFLVVGVNRAVPASVELSFSSLSVVSSCPDPAGGEISPILPLGQHWQLPPPLAVSIWEAGDSTVSCLSILTGRGLERDGLQDPFQPNTTAWEKGGVTSLPQHNPSSLPAKRKSQTTSQQTNKQTNQSVSRCDGG